VRKTRFFNAYRAPFFALPFLASGAVGATYFSALPGQTSVANLFNILLAIPAFYGLRQASGNARALMTLVALSVFAFSIESLAVLSGIPYGRFSYGPNLGQKLFGLVPLTLPVSWIPIVLGSRVWAVAVCGRERVFVVFLLSVFLMVAFDLIIDPGAVSLKYWTWEEAGDYYGIPETNFVGWLISSTLAQALVTCCLRPTDRLPWIVTFSMIWGLFFWTGIAILEGRIALIIWAGLLGASWLRCHARESTGSSLVSH